MKVTWRQLIELSERPDRLTLVGTATRPGIHRFFITLEYEYFKPGTPANDEYTYTRLRWPSVCPLDWAMVMIPLAAKPQVERVAEETNMRLANGIPMLIGVGGSGVDHFPICHDRVHTVQNAPSSPLYLPDGEAFVREEENRWVAEFLKQKGLDVTARS